MTAEKAVRNVIETSECLGDAFALADLKRLAGRLFLTQDRNHDARRAFEAAVEIGHRQDAALYVLRAGRDLARLLAKSGDKVRAWEILSPITKKVSEHRAGLDFQEALNLLSTLSGEQVIAS